MKRIKTKRIRNGFTVAELLIVVAIIAVLVAVAIPVFTTQLEKSREATDMANMRSAYAEAVADLLASEDGGGISSVYPVMQTIENEEMFDHSDTTSLCKELQDALGATGYFEGSPEDFVVMVFLEPHEGWGEDNLVNFTSLERALNELGRD